MQLGDFLRDHVWIPVIGAVLIALLLIIAAYYIYRCRRHRQYDYTALEEEMALPEKLRQERQQQYEDIREKALLDCQFYLRSTRNYTFHSQLPDIGSRLNKNWFLVRDHQSDRLLTMMPRPLEMTIAFNNVTKRVLGELCQKLQHPYIYPVVDIDFTVEQDQIVTIQPFNYKGSLKDLIYNSQCRDSWTAKYNYCSKGIPSSQIQLYGRQVLEALMFLEDKGFPRFLHLHSGNVIIQNQTAKLTGWENTLLELPPKLASLIRKKTKNKMNAIDPICFGHLVFEMAAGFKLDSAAPGQHHLDMLNNTAIIEVLDFIFDPNDRRYPTISKICALDFFQAIDLRDLNTFHCTSFQFSQEVKTLLKYVRKRRLIVRSKSKRDGHGLDSERARSGGKTSQKSQEAVSAKSKKSKLKSKMDASNQSAFSPPIPPPPPVSTRIQPSDNITSINITSEHSALLGDIRRGTRLKKTVTNDRSTPRV